MAPNPLLGVEEERSCKTLELDTTFLPVNTSSYLTVELGPGPQPASAHIYMTAEMGQSIGRKDSKQIVPNTKKLEEEIQI